MLERFLDQQLAISAALLSPEVSRNEKDLCNLKEKDITDAEDIGQHLYLQQWTAIGTLTWCIIKNMALIIQPKSVAVEYKCTFILINYMKKETKTFCKQSARYWFQSNLTFITVCK